MHDPDGTNIVLASRIPDEAIDALGTLDWSQHRGEYLTWDAERCEWHDRTRPQR